MDAVGLKILLKEIEADCAVIQDAARKALIRSGEGSGGNLAACAYELARFYNVLEKIFERICRNFENHFDKRDDYYERLIQRLALNLPEIRPAYIPREEVRAIRELKGFRHVVRHAYDLDFKKERLKERADLAIQVAAKLPQWSTEFDARTRLEQGWD